MDQITADLSSVPDAHEDGEVVLLGCQGDSCIAAEEIARLAGTVNYEVTTSLLPRLPRVYVRGGEVVEVTRLSS
jgi:alanine racemase